MTQQFTFGVCSISLNSADTLRLIGVPGELLDGFRQAVCAGWNRGIQREGPYSNGAYEIKLNGNPWYNDSGETSVWSRGLIISILTFLAKNGWNLIQAADLSKKSRDKDTMFFENAPQADHEAQIFSISFNRWDRIRVIGAPGMMPVVRGAVEKYWPRGIQREKDCYGALELKLSGNPWIYDGPDAIMVRNMMNHVLADCRAVGFKLYGSIDISYGQGEHATEVESWFLRKVGPCWW